MSIRPVRSVSLAQPTREGAGVSLHRAFGFGKTAEFDPFLLFDDFRNDRPEDYQAGFPWHPHRGIETITYVLSGNVEHGDSLGNRGTLGAGDVQWMTAGSGIMLAPPAITEDRMTGLRFPAGDIEALAAALTRLLNLSEPARHAIGVRGQAWVSDLQEPAAVAERTLRLYMELTAARTP